MTVTGIVMLDRRIELSVWAEKYSYDPGLSERVADFRTRNKYAMPIKEFIPTSSLSLREIQEVLPGFLAPQMYYVVEDNTKLERLIKGNIIENGPRIVNDFDRNLENEICKNIT